MTREEAIDILDDNFTVIDTHGHFSDEEVEEARQMAIKSLEQKPILDKIRAEIERQEKWLLQAGYTAYNVDIAFDAIKAVLAESEEGGVTHE